MIKCVHCGKENREDTIFCMKCGRPVKRQYERYTCEIYSGDSIVERILAALGSINFNSIKSEKDYTNKKYRQDTHRQRKQHSGQWEHPMQQLEQTVKNAADSIKDVYEEYVEKNRSEESRPTDEIPDESAYEELYETTSYENEEPEYSEETNWHSTESLTRQSGTDMPQAMSSSGVNGNLLKFAFGLLMFLMVMIPSCSNMFNNDVTEVPAYDEAIQAYDDYQFPSSLELQGFAEEQMDEVLGGTSAEQLFQYLSMIDSDIGAFKRSSNVLYSTADYAYLQDFFDKAAEAYNNNSDYEVMGDLIYLNSQWMDLHNCLTEEKEYFSDEELENGIESFRLEFNRFCDTYLE